MKSDTAIPKLLPESDWYDVDVITEGNVAHSCMVPFNCGTCVIMIV